MVPMAEGCQTRAVLVVGAWEGPSRGKWMQPMSKQHCPNCIWQNSPLSSTGGKRGGGGAERGTFGLPPMFFLVLLLPHPCSESKGTHWQPQRWQAGSKQNPAREQNPISGTRRMRARSPTGLTWALASPFCPVQDGYEHPTARSWERQRSQ